jgi:TonB family protein
MRRDPNIPLFLWIATAALAHILWGGGAEETVKLLEGRQDIARLMESVRAHVKRSNQRVEVTLLDERTLPPTEEDRATPSGPVEDPTEPKLQPQEPKAEELLTPKAAKPLDERSPKQEADKAEPPKPEVPKKADLPEPAKLDVKPLQPDQRISVVQSVKDPKQAPNDEARFIADQANRVEQETQARITSHDQNDPEPVPGLSHPSNEQAPGNATQEEVASHEDVAGDPSKLPSENAKEGKDSERPSAAAPQTAPNVQTLAFGEPAPQNARPSPDPKPEPPASRGRQAQAQQAAVDAFPNTVQTDPGSFSIAAEQMERAAQTGQRAQAHRDQPKARKRLPDVRGFGALGTTPGGLNPNLTPLSAFEAIGGIRLTQERRADGERRRSKHRGSWNAVGLERWRSAIENYVASVQPGNQTALNTAAVPFASYINQVHQRIHSTFADTFLVSLDALPADHPMNRPDLHANLEIVLSHEDGRVIRMGVTRASGSTSFDVSALESVQRASPFGASPKEIVSPDGNVYLHWEFYRDGKACSTAFARPYLLRVAPKSAPVPTMPITPKTEPAEHGKLKPRASEVHG